jgi:16S rRNA (adenine1518-N6/adenine1519-N6)-dimethyltransferase
MSNPRHILEEFEIFPKKSLGQNFLHDPNTLRKIVDIAQVGPHDTILEIGPGTGALTAVLAEHAKEVHSVEVDGRLMPILEEELEPYDNVHLYFMDFLDADIEALVGEQSYKVVANLPYYITSAILRKVLEEPHKPESLTVMVQKQVAERIVAKPDDMSILTVSVQYYGQPKIAMTLKPSVFWPRPDVDSSVVHMQVYPQTPLDVPDEGTYFEVVRAGFGQKRKQLKNSLASNLGLSPEDTAAVLAGGGIDGMRRAETLTLEEWAALARSYANLS